MSADIWRTWKNETYTFWSNCPFDIKPKLSDENKMPIEGKSCDYQGYHYEVKKVDKNGKQWYKVVKTPITLGDKSELEIAADKTAQDMMVGVRSEKSTNWDEVERKRKERDAGFEQRHKESMTNIENNTEAIKALTDRVVELIQKLDKVMKV